ncbi:A/G-specific adenine glycosylase [Psychroserpens sp.]|uniref:A/G-specific adenine glycosylase n=1 Tax=Psychroserpens sp. TaxID=2020870 RepID=UPI001AFE27AE|nr:A/G-specific adenine glycosylase [Psychroserpens sp.]MBO6605586.1 A/G-specific adenine glycosylase [Psychroserpens sp.]MBO6630045.1 A/G-specific adenine glycosylase [Psychroserpens sp.]MBO6653605.1 A/G-specific adenine glycosylase [Psychroserpens sp.]MBO6681926.1 A/G-specific adenine glycosylase [Psychroserpens sp.]MBO6748960.1 A/G-specific adenine glycosylase [Psychroserpens sp.]
MNFTEILTHWYSDNKRNLPWRETKNPYNIWLSEIILQQTQIKQGLPYYEAFVNHFPTVFDLANASEEQVLKLWQGLGYYSRARNLHSAAKFIASECNGIFPSTYSEIIKLKGVGDYTASAIASICFDEPTAVVDGNVYRVLSRYFGLDTPINSTKGIKEFKAIASTLIDHERPGDYNQAIMEFGAMQCKPKNPYCIVCPLKDSCKALQNGLVEKLPVKLKKTKITKKHINFLVLISSDKQTIFEKRTSKGIWRNLYQFPLIESETPLQTENFRSHKEVVNYFNGSTFEFSLYNTTDVIHKLSHQHLHTRFWIIEIDQLPKAGMPITSLQSFPAPVLISNFIEEFGF